MSAVIWSNEPIKIVQEFEARGSGRGDAGAFILWAVWGVESLYYLDDLDNEHRKRLDETLHDPNVKDISHVRWATGTAISSLDLCAAALGRLFCPPTTFRELDLRSFDPSVNDSRITARRASLSGISLAWVDDVLSDQRYLEVLGARNPLTHSRLIRQLFLNQPTQFKVPKTGNAFTTRDLVTLSKNLASNKVSEFLNVLETI